MMKRAGLFPESEKVNDRGPNGMSETPTSSLAVDVLVIGIRTDKIGGEE